MTDENEELRPSKMRGVAFPKAKYGVILAIILWVGWHVLTARSESNELDRLSRKRHGPNDHKSNITDW